MLDRRDFISSVLASLAAPLLPQLTSPVATHNLDQLAAMVNRGPGPISFRFNGIWIDAVFVYPTQEYLDNSAREVFRKFFGKTQCTPSTDEDHSRLIRSTTVHDPRHTEIGYIALHEPRKTLTAKD